MGKEFYAEPDSAKAKYVLKLSRTDLARFIPLISGHNSLFYFRSKIDAEVNPSCRFCMEAPGTFMHFVNDCPPFDRRDKFLNQIISNDHMWSEQTLLDFSLITGIDDALRGDTRIEIYRQHDDQSEISSSEDSEDPDSPRLS